MQIPSLVVLVILLGCSAMISGAEVAFFSLSSSDLETAEDSASRKLAIVKKLLEKPKKLLATILVANNFINIAIVLLFESLSRVWFEGWSYEINLYFFEVSAVFLVKVVAVTFLILLFGEILPKVYTIL